MESDISDESSANTSMSDDGQDLTWIEWFCRLKGNEFFVEIDEEYIEDDFNLTGLSQIVPYYDEALSMILDEDDQNQVEEEDQAMLETACQMLYGLVHARFLLTTRGIQALYDKYASGTYGLCWNESCQAAKQYVLPLGSDVVGQSGTNVFCPGCGEWYIPRNPKLSQLDGAYFGSSAAHMLVMQNQNLVSSGATEPYLPLLYGFRIFPHVRAIVKERKAQQKLALESNSK